MQPLTQHGALFTIYQSKSAIELRMGCDDRPNLRIISTSKSYESAYQVAQMAADSKQIPLQNYVPLELVETYSY